MVDVQISQDSAQMRLIMDEPYPGCPRCMQINEIEIYGETITSFSEFSELGDGDENDESVSIIGKLKRNSEE